MPPTEYKQVSIDSLFNYKGNKALYFHLPGWKDRVGISFPATVAIKITDPLDIGFKPGSAGELLGPDGSQRQPEDVIALIKCRNIRIPFIFIDKK